MRVLVDLICTRICLRNTIQCLARRKGIHNTTIQSSRENPECTTCIQVQAEGKKRRVISSNDIICTRIDTNNLKGPETCTTILYYSSIYQGFRVIATCSGATRIYA